MARQPKAFALYPTWVLDVIQRMCNGEQLIQLEQGDKGTATSSAHMFNRGRLAFARERAVDSPREVEIALDIVARVVNLQRAGLTGRYLLEFSPRGLAILADKMKKGYSELSDDGLPSFHNIPLPQETLNAAMAQMNPAASDPIEDMLERSLNQGRAPTANAAGVDSVATANGSLPGTATSDSEKKPE